MTDTNTSFDSLLHLFKSKENSSCEEIMAASISNESVLVIRAGHWSARGCTYSAPVCPLLYLSLGCECVFRWRLSHSYSDKSDGQSRGFNGRGGLEGRSFSERELRGITRHH